MPRVNTVPAALLPILAACLLTGCPAGAPPKVNECDQWEYKVQYSLPTPHQERYGEEALTATSITPSAQELTALGAEGWELAGLYLEQETAYPQFTAGTPVESNVRPQRLVLIFKRGACK